MKIFLDDIRMPKDCLGYMHTRIGALNPIYSEEWEICRNFSEFQFLITTYCKEITHISFDHDLADFHYSLDIQDYEDMSEDTKMNLFGSIDKDGYDCAKWMLEFYTILNLPLPTIIVHSMNPVGRERISNLFKLKL